MSVDGSHIYIVIRADELDLKRVAEESKYTMQLAIGLTDLTSLEPCDYLYKPFRKCQNKPDDILQTEKTLEEYFSIVEGNVKDTLEDNPNKHQVKESVIGNMSNAELITYKEYLRIMKEGFADFQAHTLNRPHMKGVHLRTMAVNGLEEANREGAEKGGAKLYNLWQRLGWKHRIGAFVDFVDEPDTEYLWRKYIADETLKRSLFRDVDRIKLTDIILNKTIYNKSLFSSGYVSCGFAFHNEFDLFGKPRFSHEERENIMEDQEVELQAKVLFAENIPRGLMKSWRCVLPSPSKIRNYFGEKIAFYFHFLNFLTVALIIPGIIGIIAFVLQIVFDVDDSGTDGGIADYNNAIFTLILVIWSAAFYEYWKRQEVKYSVLWGQTDFEEDQVQRVEFFGIMRRSPIDDKREMYFSSFARMFRMLISTCVTLFMMCLTIALILGTFALKEYLIEEFSGDFIEPYIPTIISTLNAFQIYFFNQVYNYIAFLLTKFENHKTQTVFERSLIVKTFTFSFVNGFNSLFYIAFIKQEREG